MTHLRRRLVQQLQTQPDRLAIDADRQGRGTWTYGQMAMAIGRLRSNMPDSAQVVGVLANQCPEAYFAVLACYLSGRTFVPLNPKFPHERLDTICSLARPDLILFAREHADTAASLGTHTLDISTTVTTAAHTSASDEATAVAEPRQWQKFAYQMFTSGSTGIPKGVPISFDNLSAYVENISTLLDYPSGSRCSQLFDLSFDLSMHDIFVTLAHGGVLVPPSASDLLIPAAYIQKQRLDVWFSVPFVARQATATPPRRESGPLKLALFCGEALPTQYARDFGRHLAADGQIINLYGPTEATIAFTAHQYCSADNAHSTVPIGHAFGTNQTAILDDQKVLPTSIEGLEGELLLAGEQVFLGYSNSDHRPFISDNAQAFYRTGDLVRCSGGTLHFLERLDTQVKVRGNRIELSEVEQCVYSMFEIEAAVALVIDVAGESSLALAYAARKALPIDREQLRKKLPDYMVPTRVKQVDFIPLNANGKVDRNALRQMDWTA